MNKRTWRGRGEQVVRDLRFGVRALRRSPAASAVAVLSVALGIGANTAIFSMLYAIAWRPLQVANPEALVQLQASSPEQAKRSVFRLPFFEDFANSDRSLSVSRSIVRTGSRDALAIARTA